MKSSKLSILLLFLVMILAISAVSAADTNETSDSTVQAVDEAPVDEVASTDVDAVAATDDAAVLSAGEQNFTQLQTAVNTGTVLMSNDYVRQAGEDTISVDNDVTIVGNEMYKIDGNNLGGIFNVNSGCTLTLIGVTLINGNAENGGAIYNNGGTLTITDSYFLNNTATYKGGAIYNNGGSASIIGSIFYGNNITDRSNQDYGGAAIYDIGGDVLLSDCEISNHLKDIVHRSGYDGVDDMSTASVTSHDGSLTVTGTYFANNNGNKGGAIEIDGSNAVLNVVNSIFEDNFAFTGGAIYFYGNTYTISGSTFRGNTAKGSGSAKTNVASGGAICAFETATGSVITGCTFENNGASLGGAVCTQNTVITGCNFTDNSAGKSYNERWRGTVNNNGGKGGAVYVNTNGDVTIEGSNFTDNFDETSTGSKLSYGIYICDKSTSEITGSSLANTRIYVAGASDSLAVSDNIYDNDVDYDIDMPKGGSLIVGDGQVPRLTGSGNTNVYADVTNFTDLQSIIFSVKSGSIHLTNDVTKLGVEYYTFADGISINKVIAIYGDGHSIISNDGKVFTVDEGSALRLYNTTIVGDGTSAIVNNGALSLYANNPNTFINVGEYAVENNGTVNALSATTFTQLTDIIALVDTGDISISTSKITKADDEKDAFKNGIIIDRDLTIIGVVNNKGVIQTYIDADNDGRIFAVTEGATLSLENIILKNGNVADADGGAVYVDGDSALTADTVEFIDNTAYCNGGAVYVNNATVVLSNCLLDGNKVTEISTNDDTGGAAIFANNSEVYIRNSKITNNGNADLNRTEGDMVNAVVNLIDSNALISGSLFEGNTAIYGGAISASTTSDSVESKLTVVGTEFTNNKAYNGAAIYIYSDCGNAPELEIDDSVFDCNFVVGENIPYTSSGGAIAIGDGCIASIDNITVINSHADSGGAIWIQDSAVSIDGSRFENNSAENTASAIMVMKSLLSVSDSTFKNNTAGYAAIYMYVSANVNITDSNFTDNTDLRGFAVIVVDSAGEVNIEGCNLTNSEDSSTAGVAVYPSENVVYDVNVTIRDSVIDTPDVWGVYSTMGSLSLSNNAIIGVSYPIYVWGDAEIVSTVKANISENKTYYKHLGEVTFDTKLTDDTGVNLIDDYNFKYIIYKDDVKYDEVSAFFDGVSYPASYIFTEPGTYVVNVDYPSRDVATATYIISASLTDLKNRIAAADPADIIVLDFDYAYIAEYDAGLENGIEINKTITIDGNGSVIYGSDAARIFNVTSGIFTLNNVALCDGAADKGAAVYVGAGADLITENATFINNIALEQGGAIYSEGNLYITSTEFIANEVTNEFDDDTLTGGSEGGAIYVKGNVDVNIVDSNFTENKATPADHGDGGAIYAEVNNIAITGTTFEENKGFIGGAVFLVGVDQDDLVFNNCTFDSNVALQGGAINAVSSLTLNINDTVFIDNMAYSNRYIGKYNDFAAAAAIGSADGSNIAINVNNSKFIENVVVSGPNNNSGFGAAIVSTGSLIVDNSEFSGNVAPKFAVIRVYYGVNAGYVNITNSNFTENVATEGNAGVIYVAGKTLNVTGCMFIDNTAAGNGSVIYINTDAEAYIQDSLFTDNGDEDDYAVYNLGKLTLDDRTVVDNFIYNSGVIESEIVARLNDNLTLPAEIGDIVPLNATLKVGRNVIYDPRFNITVNNEDVPTEFADGVYTAVYLIEHAGDHIVSTYFGVADIIKIGIYTVPKSNVTEFALLVADKPYGENVTVYVYMYGVDYEGLNVTDLLVIVNNKEYTVNITDGEGSFNVTDLIPGEYAALAIFEGSSDYNKAYASDSFTVLDTGLEIDVNIDDITYLDNALIEVFIANDASFTGVVDVYIGLEKYRVPVIDGIGNLLVSGLHPEEYHYWAEFSGDDVYAPVVTESETFYVTPRYVYVDVNTYDGVAYGEVGSIKVVLTDMEGNIIVDDVELYFTDEDGDPINWTVITTANDMFGPDGRVDLEFTKDLDKGTYYVTVSSSNFLFVEPFEDDDYDTVWYKFTSYGDDNGNVEYGDGTVIVIGEEIDGVIPVQVLTNEFDDSFAGRVFYIDADAVADGITLNQLYEMGSIPLYVEIYVDEDTYSFIAYNEQGTSYGQGTFDFIGEEVDGFVPIEVITCDYEQFVGSIFYLNANVNADDGELYQVHKVIPVNIWVTVSVPIWDATVEYPVHSSYIDAIVVDGEGEYQYGEDHVVAIQLVNNVYEQELIEIDCSGMVTVYSVDEDGNMTVLDSVDVEFEDGVLFYDVSDFEVGNYRLAVTINDDNYEFHKEFEGEYFNVVYFYDDEDLFTVEYADVDLEVSVDDITYGEDANVTITITSNDKGLNATVYVGVSGVFEEDIPVEIVNGTVTFTIPEILDAGTYVVSVEFYGDEHYKIASDFDVFDVGRAAPDISVVGLLVETVDNEGAVSFNVTGPDGHYDISIYGGEPVHVKITDGNSGMLYFEGLDVGEQTIIIEFDGNENYYGNVVEQMFEVDVVIDPEEVSVEIDGDYPDGELIIEAPIDGTYYVTINVTEGLMIIPVEVIDGQGNVSFSNLKPGFYNATVSIDEPNYVLNKDVELAYLQDPDFDVAIGGTYPNGLIEVYGPPGNYHIYIEGIEEVIDLTIIPMGGGAQYIIPDIAAGNYTAYVVFDANGTYRDDEEWYDFTIEKATPEFDVTTDVGVYPGNLTVTVSSDIDGNASVTISSVFGLIIASGDIQGNGSFNVPYLDAGEYLIYVEFDAGDNYTIGTNSSTVLVEPQTINPDDVNVTIYNDWPDGVITVESPVDGTYTIIIGNYTVDVNVDDGEGFAYLGVLEPGFYNATVVLVDFNYNFTNDVELAYMEDPDFDVFVSGTYPAAEIIIQGPSGNYHVYIDDIEAVFDLDILDMGIVIYTFEGIDAGEHTGYAVFDGNGTYNPDAIDFNFTIENATSNVIIYEPIDDVVYGDDVIISYEMINGTFDKSIFVLVDAKGNMGFTLDYDNETVIAHDLPAGIYTLTIYNTGDANHDESMDSATFEVVKDEAIDIEFIDVETLGVYCSFGVNITVAPDATGLIYINRNGITDVEELLEGGYYYFDEIITPEDGLYTIEVFYLGDDNYNATFDSETLVPEYSNIVTNETFFGYFNEYGILSEDVTYDELIFVGNFSGLGVNVITLNRPIEVYSEGETWTAVFYDMGLYITADGVTVSNLAFVNDQTDFSETNYGAAIYVDEAEDVALDHIGLVYRAPEDADPYGIYVIDSDRFALTSSLIYFIGNESNENYQYGIRVEGSDDVIIAGNSLYAALPARAPVSYTSDIDDDLVLAVGIKDGNNILFTDNNVFVRAIGETSYTTLDAIMVSNVTDLEISYNNIYLFDDENDDVAYYHAVDLYNFEGSVLYNNITVNTTTGVPGYGDAYPIQLSGPYTAVVSGNNLTAISNGPSIGILSYNWAGEADLEVTDNNITVIGSGEPGSYNAITSGIELQVTTAKVYYNYIDVDYIDDEYSDDLNVYGISNAQWSTVEFLDIENNEVYSAGKYAVYIKYAADGTVTGNFLIAYDLVGDEAVCDDTMEAIDVDGNYPADLELIVYAYDVNVTEDIVIDIFTNELFSGEVTVVINGVHKVEIVDGKGTLVLDSLPANTYTVTAFYEGDDYFPSGYDEDTFEVLRFVSEMTITTGDVVIDEDLAVNITLPGVTGEITVIVDGENDTVNLTDGLGSFIIPFYDMTAGDHSIIAIFYGDDLYEPATAVKNFTVEKAEDYPFDVNITVDEITIGDNVTFNVTLPEDAYGEIIVSVNGEEVAWEEVEEGEATVTIPADAFTAGMINTVEVTYTDDDKYAETTVLEYIYVDKLTYDLSATADDIELGDVAIIIVNLPEDIDGDVYAVLEGIEYYADEFGIITIEDLPIGNYTAIVYFEDDSVYEDNETEVTFKVTKIEIPAEDAFNITTPENATSPEFTVTLPEDATGFLLLDINGTQTFVPLVNGTATARVPSGFAPGNYTAVVTYTGDDKYDPITTTQNVTVESNVPDNAFTIPDTAKDGEPLTYSINLPSDAKGYLEVDVDGKTYVAALVNGSASITVPGLSAGNHNVTVKYTGDGKYSPVTKSMAVSVPNPVYKITNNNNVAVVYSGSASYKVLVTKDGKAIGAGQSVTITFNGKKYTVKTDSKGYAILKLNTKLKVKKYTITAQFKGVTVKNTVTIKQLIKAKNTKIKKSKKVNKIKVRTNKVNGKFLKGKKLTLKIKGKKIKAKINKKGVAVFKLKKSVTKKLKAGKKYKYTVSYGKDTITKKVKVKK